MSLTHNIVKSDPKKKLKPPTHESYVDKLEKLPGNDTVNCRHLKSRNQSEIFILSAKNMTSGKAQDIEKMLSAINPDGIVLGCCLKRFKFFYNAYNNDSKTPLSQYVSDFLAVNLI